MYLYAEFAVFPHRVRQPIRVFETILPDSTLRSFSNQAVMRFGDFINQSAEAATSNLFFQ